MEQETLEAAKSYGEPYRCPATNENEYCKHDIISAFNNGAKWQSERMYSEEDMRCAYKYGKIWDMTSFEDWFEQYKNK